MGKESFQQLMRGITSICIALLVVIFIIIFVSKEPVNAIYNFIFGVFSNSRYLISILERSTPLIFTGLAISIMFSANQLNIGAEGTFFFGAIIATIFGISLNLPIGLHFIVCSIGAMIVGGFFMLIPGIIKTKLKSSEIVSSLMMNYILLYLGLFIIRYYFRDPNSGFSASFPFNSTACLPSLVPNTKFNIGFIIAITLCLLFYLFIFHTKWGYEIRMVGSNRFFANHSGIDTNKVIILAQVLGGIIAGLGGAVEILGTYSRFQWQSLPGYGWDGIIVAILAKNNPILIPITAIFIAYLKKGGDLMQLNTDVQAELVVIVQAIIFLFFAAEQFLSKSKHKQLFSIKKAPSFQKK